MDVIEQAQRYIAAIPPAVSGASGHNQTFSVAMALVEGFALSISEAKSLMIDYSQRCSPPWSEREIQHKLEDAERRADPSKRGKLIRKGVKYHDPDRQSSRRSPPVTKTKSAHYEVSDDIELPDPLPDGARQFIRAAFLSGEGVRIALARTDEDGREIPKDAGVTLSREEWLKKLDAHQGNPNGFFKTSDRNGIFVSVNPMKIGGSKDADVTDFRHALLEFDAISREEQWGIIIQSRVPCSAIISSGRKSIHAWVKIAAKDRREFDERVKILYQHFAEYKPDEKNKNPSRFSRLPNCERGNSRQELLALNIGCESFSEWQALHAADGIGDVWLPKDLREFDFTNDPNKLIGEDWIGKGMACLIVGPSGVGKSSLNLQFVILWGIGKPAFGIVPMRPLKSLVIQAENSKRDAAKVFLSICRNLGIEECSQEEELIDRNVVFVRDSSHTGEAFTSNLRRLIDQHKPDLVWLDPLLSFVGDDISRQLVIAQFFRNQLSAILDATGVAIFCMHHTGKPPSDSKARQHWQTSDYAYAGLGHSDLTNWFRAVMVLQDRGQGLFELKLAKRGVEARVIGEDGQLTKSIWLRHSAKPNEIFWEATKAPEQAEPEEKRKGQKSKVAVIAASNLAEVLNACPKEGESANAIGKRLHKHSRKVGKTLGETKCRTDLLDALVENGKLTYSEKFELYFKGKNA